MLNTNTFEAKFGSIIASKIDTSAVRSRKEAWNVYFELMMESPVLIKTMPESEVVVSTMQTVFHNVDWVN
ncbi:hypothetical protein PHIM7_125 [Sinorhizobium phage phiM7]|uniref:Uncharacterized protein n=3 Tax=Emdodecavirus TaxID=1980937 RepID=S5M6X4_9CAUD|nr:hypothetical protein AB690_gp371 [Sinorhizobium phage phiM12]YP_009212379.1 hypothetical protein AVT40_gp394 [Sinorhizobium phage phiN3]YP_009601250.1 hypothetical protein FDH46_gp353 [Sinorhizobium phage phiM7]AKF13031.1 hypothetical protein PHIM19_126 [Sinorhizobium phage phiM19]AGR47816.1 hypothetical protein SmphiM12_184 [Sinorhizobium phage phiM12]AKF12671.1 hypothetical protein PHIM7_125 [Sinorhizobium phage phiM7]AKF13402.1 hypothetical protein PHIN3_139 [Sinorhizobium phage phiN3]